MAFAVLGGDPVPGFDRIGLFEAQLRHIVAVFNLFEVDVDLVADVRLVEFEKFGRGNETFRLVTDVDQRAVRTLRDDGAFDDLALVEGVGASGTLEQFVHRAREVGEIQEAVRKFGFFCHVVCVLVLSVDFPFVCTTAGTDPSWILLQPDKKYITYHLLFEITSNYTVFS